jgi:hypothetical protein
LRPARVILAAFAVCVAVLGPAAPATSRSDQWTVSREAVTAIVSRRNQHITIYDDRRAIRQAPVSNWHQGRETPAGAKRSAVLLRQKAIVLWHTGMDVVLATTRWRPGMIGV